jgi:hypothetical protein
MSFPNRTPISSNDYASIIWTWRLGEYLLSLHLRIGATSIYEFVSSVPCFWLPRTLVSSILASICSQVEKKEEVLLVCGGRLSKREVVLLALGKKAKD